MTATEQVRDEAGVQVLPDAARAHRDEDAHNVDASQRQAYLQRAGTPRRQRCQRKVVRRNSSTLSMLAAVTGSPAGRSMERRTLLSA